MDLKVKNKEHKSQQETKQLHIEYTGETVSTEKTSYQDRISRIMYIGYGDGKQHYPLFQTRLQITVLV